MGHYLYITLSIIELNDTYSILLSQEIKKKLFDSHAMINPKNPNVALLILLDFF